MTPNEPDAVAIARMEEQLKTVFNQLEGMERAISQQGSDISEMRADLTGFIGSVRAQADGTKTANGLRDSSLTSWKAEHERAEQTWRETHQEEHKADARRLYAVVGVAMTALTIITGLVVHFL